MSKNERNYWLNWVLFLVFLITIISGFLLWIKIPNNYMSTFTRIDRTALVTLHIGSGLIGLLGVVIHINWHWSWLKALRYSPVRRLNKHVRTNRIINRLTWLAYITSTVFGLLAWMLSSILSTETIKIFSRFHVTTSLGCLVLLVTHLSLHKKWIVSAIQRYSPGKYRWRLGQKYDLDSTMHPD